MTIKSDSPIAAADRDRSHLKAAQRHPNNVIKEGPEKILLNDAQSRLREIERAWNPFKAASQKDDVGRLPRGISSGTQRDAKVPPHLRKRRRVVNSISNKRDTLAV